MNRFAIGSRFKRIGCKQPGCTAETEVARADAPRLRLGWYCPEHRRSASGGWYCHECDEEDDQ